MTADNQSRTTYYLEMHSREALQGKPLPVGFEVVKLSPPDPVTSRRLWETVGAPWRWHERLLWTDEQWQQHLAAETLHTWVGRHDRQEAGLAELQQQDDHSVQILYFGLAPDFIGRGLGGPMLTAAIENAWSLPGTKRVWLHTCTHDHPHALDNYRGRGFELYKTV